MGERELATGEDGAALDRWDEGRVTDQEERGDRGGRHAEPGQHRLGRDSGGQGRRGKQRSFLTELPFLIVIALGLALVIKTFLIQAFYIPSGSMENTLVPGDRVLVNKLAYRFGDINRGDVVVFNGVDSWESEVDFPEPSNFGERVVRKVGELFGFQPIGEKDFIKRVIGLPGDHVVCCDSKGRVTVNGTPLQEQGYLFPGNAPSTMPFDIRVPPGRLWVMGDHRRASADSRLHLGDPGGGTIPIDHVVGRAVVIVWPLDRARILTRPPTYQEAGLALAPAGR